jgi:hypothetical protein
MSYNKNGGVERLINITFQFIKILHLLSLFQYHHLFFSKHGITHAGIHHIGPTGILTVENRKVKPCICFI